MVTESACKEQQDEAGETACRRQQERRVGGRRRIGVDEVMRKEGKRKRAMGEEACNEPRRAPGA